MVPVAFDPDLGSCRDELRPLLALYAGGMGSAGANFYKDLVTRYGFGDAANAIQEAYLDGRKTEAAAPRPGRDDRRALPGRLGRARPRPSRRPGAQSGVTTLLAKAQDVRTVRALAEAAA